MKQIIPVIIIAVAFASCSGSHKVTTVKNDAQAAQRKKTACGNVHIDMNQAHLDWFEESNSIVSKADEVLVLPKDYKIYTLDTAQITEFFNAIKFRQPAVTVLPLPKPADCQLFTISSNQKEGVRLPKGAIMGWGEAKGQSMAISYYMGNLAGNIDWFDIHYEIMTIKIKGEPYYLVYEKTPPPDNKLRDKNPAASQPELLEIRYDK